MVCFRPLKAYQSFEKVTKNGKGKICFDHKTAGHSKRVDLPCGQCIGCRIDRSKAWALRCVHEASLYEHNCFITLTFDDDHIDFPRQSLDKGDFQRFMKRLRKRYEGLEEVFNRETVKKSRPIRYFHCGEYGAEMGRPHHHACIFNFDFMDKVLWKCRDGVRLYRSSELEKLWPYGYSAIGDVTWQSAAYVARYITKKMTGEAAKTHYMRVDRDTGEVFYIEPEYITMSRRPGIGKEWYLRYKDDLFPKDFVTHDGKKFKIPSYYDKLYDCDRPKDFSKIRKKRLKRAAKHADNNTWRRLAAREVCQERKVKTLGRSMENEARYL